MFAGLTYASEASFAIGTSISAQPELNVPITPRIDSSSTYLRALAAHVASSQAPFAAVESSNASNETVKSPTLPPIDSR